MNDNQPKSLAVRDQGFSQDQVDLIRRTVANGATNDELAMFLHQASRAGLDPLARQIHFSKFKSKDGQSRVSIITGIDGYRLVADRTGLYAGSDDYTFDSNLSQYEHMKTAKKPITATVTVYKLVGDQRMPFTATAAWDAYCPPAGRDFMWSKMPYLMLGKCAEALALRKAFPAELSGMYVREEMEQAGVVEGEFRETTETKKIERPLSPDVLKDMLNKKAAKHAGIALEPGKREKVMDILATVFESRERAALFFAWAFDATGANDAGRVQALWDWLAPAEVEGGLLPSTLAMQEAKAAAGLLAKG